MEFEFFKIETFIPEEYVEELRECLNSIGALTIGGNYDNCMAVSRVTGYWRPLSGADPFKGEAYKVSREIECKIEFSCKSEILKEVLTVIKKVHPYEVPVINVLPNFLK
ncbi:hypothetical protein CPAST_c13820 [Clostridium pasteurianum DSM 525 = ATCC 6013]|uniref:Cytochrome C biogenesis protein n=1 Tax=Clostridium pasteurianum DSM 525 = ATCC 6013 TaxID=1262449 RepID=A0A0H3J0T9_CLOPA|nr:hypothetical protein [Clostridium pasteurianum]AJA47461.1 hypothetical protein CPAST_c13820 [Clostridium pasteurianum DSM 525 = ATCC 6013]AJA51449.1 hypothetical protein CLPA_c13820 [Clostridium pasteurianum DSM 525 = ATCC 6013]AOZ74786.1 cytochrome C biogenesis protein [Clostridium pasteurianum DSM 525 = ATCC 6013]AOZ78582.1 cytochrome C biogenesis protein [Clostridium pasteurianum]ELP58796.1 hypothetical protein F502_13483 [Clostridium pasteurianum DSM 525 = ATCC 6013]